MVKKLKIGSSNLKFGLVKSIYIHIPFCRSICPFCPFTVKRDSLKLHNNYVFGVINEIENRLSAIKNLDSDENVTKTFEGNLLESLYIGGGTPSRLKKDNLLLLIQKVHDFFPWSKKIEISIEMNPEDVREKYLIDVCELGVNRISLGGQSFQTSTLRKLGRSHSENQLREAIKILKNSKVNNWNLDLIFGVPGQNFSSFKDDIEEAISYNPSHISLYGLEIHEKTRFGKDQKIINWESSHKEQYREMYLWAVNRLEKSGLFQYELSNFSKKGKEGRNNLLVWSGIEYLGFGVGAHSFFRKKRWNNKSSIKFYLKDISNNKLPTDFEERLSIEQLATEYFMLSLRQKKGFNLDIWQNYFGLKLQQKQIDLVKKLSELGLANFDSKILCLTPEGFLVADRITLDFLTLENNF
tara:strand:- start:125 stop:1357 length:1233 start_codon:yes stop_codon:yes gene_type:complete